MNSDSEIIMFAKSNNLEEEVLSLRQGYHKFSTRFNEVINIMSTLTESSTEAAQRSAAALVAALQAEEATLKASADSAEATRLANESAAIALRMSNEVASYAKQARNKG